MVHTSPRDMTTEEITQELESLESWIDIYLKNEQAGLVSASTAMELLARKELLEKELNNR